MIRPFIIISPVYVLCFNPSIIEARSNLQKIGNYNIPRESVKNVVIKEGSCETKLGCRWFTAVVRRLIIEEVENTFL